MPVTRRSGVPGTAGPKEFLMRYPSVLFRGKVFAGERHAEAVDKAIVAFAPATKDQLRLVWAIDEGKEPLIFGMADDLFGANFEADEDYQEARKKMYIG